MCGQMTKSEENTIKFFESIGVVIGKVAESSEKTPDYHILQNGCSIYLEVKEIDENFEEKAIRRDVELNGYGDSYDLSPVGKRFGPKIAEANRQLKKICINNEPGIALVQDIRPFETRSLIPQEEIKQAMFGNRVIWQSVPSHKNNFQSSVTADVFGKDKVTTERKNTTISAVALLVESAQTGELALYLHHNPYARNPLPYSIFGSNKVKDYVIDSVREYGGFVEVKTHN